MIMNHSPSLQSPLTDAVTIFSASNTLPSHLGQQSWEEGNLIQIWFGSRIILIFQTGLKHERSI